MSAPTSHPFSYLYDLSEAAKRAEVRSVRRTKIVVSIIAIGAIALMAVWSSALYQENKRMKSAAEEALAAATQAQQLYDRNKAVAGIVATSPDQARYVSASGFLVDATTGSPITRLVDVKITAAQFSPSGTVIAVASDKQIFIFDIRGSLTGKAQVAATPISVRFSADGGHIAIVLRDGTVSLWKVGDPFFLVHDVHVGQAAITAAVSPNLQLVLTQTVTGELQTWHFVTGRLLVKFQGPALPSNLIGFSDDVQHVIVGYPSGELLVWDTATGAKVSKFIASNR